MGKTSHKPAVLLANRFLIRLCAGNKEGERAKTNKVKIGSIQRLFAERRGAVI